MLIVKTQAKVELMNNETNNMENHLSIGELSNLTGIGVHTLRVGKKDMDHHFLGASLQAIEGIRRIKSLA